MMKTKQKSPAQMVVELMPLAIKEEICRLANSRRGGIDEIREIMIRRQGVCSILIGCEELRLYRGISGEETEALIERLIGGALYAHRDSIANGYISLDGGVRVGVCGSAAYDGDRLVGVSDMRSLLFRIPTGKCEFSRELYEIFSDGIGQGVLIYSPPGVGKTTALRSLATSVGGGERPLRVCVVDERCEFDPWDYTDCKVDILRGYKRREGIEIATRTLSPELIMIDEIGADDGEALMGVVRCGIPLIATAHAGSRDELMSKPSLRGLFDCSVFGLLVGISRRDGSYRLTVDKL